MSFIIQCDTCQDLKLFKFNNDHVSNFFIEHHYHTSKITIKIIPSDHEWGEEYAHYYFNSVSTTNADLARFKMCLDEMGIAKEESKKIREPEPQEQRGKIMRNEVSCAECGEYIINGKLGWFVEYLKRHRHTLSFDIKIFDPSGILIDCHHFICNAESDGKYNVWKTAQDISEWIFERRERKYHEKNHEILDKIQGMLKYISENEHKLALDAKFESTASFHRGRQLLSVDILKSINSIFAQGK